MSDRRHPYSIVREHVDALARQCGRDPQEITLVSVTKTLPNEKLLAAYEAGCRHFGESRVQEALDKISKAPQDAIWHFIGTLQSNKVAKVVGHFSLIHSVDSFALAQKISQHSVERELVTSILLQVNISGEASKHGMSAEEWKGVFSDVILLPGVSVRGLMTMAPLTEDEETIRTCFSRLRQLRDALKGWRGVPSSFVELSMGMSHDYPIAIQEGATLLRIGSAIFRHTRSNNKNHM